MGKVTFDYSKAAPFIGADEVKFMEAQAAAVKDVLLKRTGAGNDFLGWIDLPVNYDREEYRRFLSGRPCGRGVLKAQLLQYCIKRST